MKTFETYGPFMLRREGEYVSRDSLRDFWDEAAEGAPGLEDAVGIYIITVRHGISVKLWYVGKTDAGFRRRLMGHADSLKLFTSLTSSAPRGQVEIMFLALKMKGRVAFRKPSKNKLNSVDQLEKMLIGACFAKNPYLLNVQRMSLYKNLRIPGYMNEGKGKPTAAASSLRKLLA